MIQRFFLPEHVHDSGIGEETQVSAQASALGIEAVAFKKVYDHGGNDIFKGLLWWRGITGVVAVDPSRHRSERVVVELQEALP